MSTTESLNNNPEEAKDPWAEKRKHKRLKFVVEIGLHTQNNFYTGLTNDISEGGLFVQTYHIFPLGTLLEVELLLPRATTPTKLLTKVVWIRPPAEMGEDNQAGMGLELVDPPEKFLRTLRRHVKRHEPLFYDV